MITVTQVREDAEREINFVQSSRKAGRPGSGLSGPADASMADASYEEPTSPDSPPVKVYYKIEKDANTGEFTFKSGTGAR